MSDLRPPGNTGADPATGDDQPSSYKPQPVGPQIKSESFEVPGMTLSRKHWNRLKAEAEEAKMGWTELWLGAAFAFLGLSGASWIALWALPDPDKGTHLSAETKDLLRIIGIFALFVASCCFLAWLQKRRDHNASLDKLIKNMESNEHTS